MTNLKQIITLLIFIISPGINPCPAQEQDNAEEEFWEEEENSNPLIRTSEHLENVSSDYHLKNNSIDTSQWKKITGGETFTDETEKKEKIPNRDTSPSRPLPALSGNLLRVIQIIALIGISVLIIIIAFRIIKANKSRNKSFDNDDEFWQINLEESEAAETEISAKLREAEDSGNFTFAIRLHYLMVLNELNRKNLIHWKKDKTNADFIRELKNTAFNKELKSLTTWFELFWFGERLAEEPAYEMLKTRFINFQKEIIASE
ncbi:MAG: hypothetical protein R2850_12260 [Bacteroidia bacterium]